MEITQRQKIIFKTIVEEFTRCAEPVGSKTLMELLDFRFHLQPSAMRWRHLRS